MTTQDDRPAERREPLATTPPVDTATTEQGSRAEPEQGSQTQPEQGSDTETSAPLSQEGRLVPKEQVMDFRARWEAIQQGFVDDPRTAVSDADTLVGDLLDRLSETFDNQPRELEGQWTDGEPSTEDLRGALQRYRDFFDRLLAI